MEKKQSTIGFILIALIFFGYMLYTGANQKKYQEALESGQALEQTVEQTPEKSSENSVAEAAPEQTPMPEKTLIIEAPEEKMVTMSNSLFDVRFNTRGGTIDDVTLKEYTKFDENERTEAVRLFDSSLSSFSLSFYMKDNLNYVKVNTAEHNFSLVSVADGGETKVATFRLAAGEDTWIDFIYTIYDTKAPERDYMIDFHTSFHNIAPLMSNQTSVGMEWSQTSFQNERSYKNENMYTTLAYHFPGEIGIEDLGIGNDSKQKSVSSSLNWVSFKQQYFNSTLIARSTPFSYADLEYETYDEHSGYIKGYAMHGAVAYTPQTEGYDFSFYLGPNKFAVLKKIVDQNGETLSIERIIPLGWIFSSYVSRWVVIPVFDFLRNFISSFGLIILILTLLVKIVIFPLTYKSYMSTAKMRVLKPEIDAIAAKFPRQEDAMKKQQATMELYRKANISPMGGCLPMLIQMPIIIAMFRFFPASIELRGQSFLWSQDLSSYDSIMQLPFNIPFYGDHISLFALLMAVSLFGISYVNYQQTGSTQAQMPGMKFMMVYMMPVMMLFWFNDYSSGLCYYYLLSNVITYIQTMWIRHMVDDEKIHAQIRTNMAKRTNGKKSKFQLKYEEMMRQAENRK